MCALRVCVLLGLRSPGVAEEGKWRLALPAEGSVSARNQLPAGRLRCKQGKERGRRVYVCVCARVQEGPWSKNVLSQSARSHAFLQALHMAWRITICPDCLTGSLSWCTSARSLPHYFSPQHKQTTWPWPASTAAKPSLF
eukprot:1160099-Pelagomonas_calceolata.AAC.8